LGLLSDDFDRESSKKCVICIFPIAVGSKSDGFKK